MLRSWVNPEEMEVSYIHMFVYILIIFVQTLYIAAGEVLQDAAAALGLKEVETIADFPEEMDVSFMYYLCVYPVYGEEMEVS